MTPPARLTDASTLSRYESSSVDGLGGMSPVAAQAYLAAAGWTNANLPACGLDASFLAGVGKVETEHGTTGGVHLRPNGATSEPIRTEGGAEGPMHFLPTEWSDYASDGNGDGVMSADNMYDATIAAAKKLCELARDLPGGDVTLATAPTRQRVAMAFDPSVIPDEAAAPEVLDFADSISASLQSYGKVLEDADGRSPRW